MIPEEEVFDHVFGYTILNDVGAKERAIGKNLYTFAPLGPYIVLKDQIGNPENLNLELFVKDNNIIKGNTKNMIFKIPYLISFISSVQLLELGDIIDTGTSLDVGPLKQGDVINAVLENIGTLRNRVSHTLTKIYRVTSDSHVQYAIK